MTLLSAACFRGPQKAACELYNLEINTLETSFSLLHGFWVFSIHTGHFSFFSLRQAKILGEGRKGERRKGRAEGRRERREGREEEEGGKGKEK